MLIGRSAGSEKSKICIRVTGNDFCDIDSWRGIRARVLQQNLRISSI
jgi:hypothetical protein